MRSAASLSIAMLVAVQCFFSEPLAARLPQARPAAVTPAATTPKPWPDAKALALRHTAAQNRKLFQSAEPLAFTLVADFKAIFRDRETTTKTFPATLEIPQPDGTTISRPVQLRGRGHSRRNARTCDFVPLRIEFAKGQAAGTVFAGSSALKLGTHCRSAAVFEQYVLREFTANRIFNLITPYSFRVRLARATYVDATTKKPIATRFAMFTEDDDDVAARMEGRSVDRPKLLFKHVDADYTTMVALLEFLIGNTDMSIFALHNIRIVETPAGTLYPVPYDLDYAGLVNTNYSAVSPILGISSVTERLYRGPCRPVTELEPFFVKLRAAKNDIIALYDQQPSFTDASRKESKAFLEDFYRLIDRPSDVKKAFVDVCTKGGLERQVGM